MSKEFVLQEIENYAKCVPHFLPKDVDNICLLSSEILDMDFLKVSKCIDKREIHQTLISILKEVDLDLPKILSNETPNIENIQLNTRFFFISQQLAIWERIWMHIWKDRADPFFERLDATVYRGIYRKVRDTIIEEITRKINLKLENTMHTEDRLRLIATLSAYLSSGIWNIIILYFKGVNSTSKKEKIQMVRKFIYLIEKGQGIPFLVGNRNNSRIEIRLPVWNVKEYPEIIDCKETDWLVVSLLKEFVFVPEKVWRFADKLTVQDIFFEPNLEVRRVMLNIIGNEKFLEQPNITLIDEYKDLKLYEVPFGERNLHIIRCICPSTNREYYLRVPPQIRDAKEAIAWTFGETKVSYQPILET